MRVWRLVIQGGKLWWFGPVHTYRIWPNPQTFDRENW